MSYRNWKLASALAALALAALVTPNVDAKDPQSKTVTPGSFMGNVSV